MSEQGNEVIAERFWSDDEVDRAVKQAVRVALEKHGRKGNLVVVERQGQVLWVKVNDVVHGDGTTDLE